MVSTSSASPSWLLKSHAAAASHAVRHCTVQRSAASPNVRSKASEGFLLVRLARLSMFVKSRTRSLLMNLPRTQI